jgi:hypothetical protein
MPRSSYDGVVMVRCRGRRLFIAPTDFPTLKAFAEAHPNPLIVYPDVQQQQQQQQQQPAQQGAAP